MTDALKRKPAGEFRFCFLLCWGLFSWSLFAGLTCKVSLNRRHLHTRTFSSKQFRDELARAHKKLKAEEAKRREMEASQPLFQQNRVLRKDLLALKREHAAALAEVEAKNEELQRRRQRGPRPREGASGESRQPGRQVCCAGCDSK